MVMVMHYFTCTIAFQHKVHGSPLGRLGAWKTCQGFFYSMKLPKGAFCLIGRHVTGGNTELRVSAPYFGFYFALPDDQVGPDIKSLTSFNQILVPKLVWPGWVLSIFLFYYLWQPLINQIHFSFSFLFVTLFVFAQDHRYSSGAFARVMPIYRLFVFKLKVT